MTEQGIDMAQWTDLERALTELARASSGRLVYVPNTGNAGDAIIESGAWQLFDRLGLRPIVQRTRQLRKGDRAIYGGGGNFVPAYHDCERFLKRCLAVGVAHALVLPHTIRGYSELLGRLDERFTLVCRDHASLQWVRAQAHQARTLLAPDLAIGLDVARLVSARLDGRGGDLRFLTLPRQAFRYVSWRIRSQRVLPDHTGHLRVFRTDVERTPDQVGAPGSDLSNLYGSPYRHRDEADRISREFLAVLARADSVETNRLHVGIAAALLGKEVLLRDNSYGKIKAVFDTSLSHLPHVRFVSVPARTAVTNVPI